MTQSLFPTSLPSARRALKPRAPGFPDWSPIPPGAVLLAIDPSIVNCGFAIIRNVRPNGAHLGSGVWHPSDAHRNRFDDLANEVAATIREAGEKGFAPTHAVIEVFSGGQRGQRSAYQLMTYARAVGVCEAVCYRRGLVVSRVTVNQWKGCTKKSYTALTARHVFPEVMTTENNTIDALMIGAWVCSQTPRSDWEAA